MPPRVIANCNPEMLAWARADAGYTLESAAEKTKYSVERLREWEGGGSKPTIPQLRGLANAYRRPLAAFFMPQPPPGFRPMHDFRRMPDVGDLRWSPALRALVRRTRAQQHAYLDLLNDLGEDRVELPRAPETDDPELVGAFARDALGVEVANQRAWSEDATALRGWTRAIEDLGVLVLHTSTTRGQIVDTREMLGFSDPGPVPAIVLNGKDHARRRTFTLLHEFTHLLLRQSGVCDLHDRFTADFDPAEVFCNAAAAAALMPADDFVADPAIRGRGPATEWDDDALGQVARRFTTSREAVLRRLLTLGRTTAEYYRAWREDYNQQFDAQRAEGDDDAPGGFANYYTMKVRELGLPYISTALEAYGADAINASDLARLLNIKLKNLARVEDEVLRALGRND